MSDQNKKTKKEVSQSSSQYLLKFKKDFDKLMSKYPDVMVTCNINGELLARNRVHIGLNYIDTKIYLD